MSRTYRNKRPRFNLGDMAETHQYKSGKVRDGTPQYYVGSCHNHGGCPICDGNRLHRQKRQEASAED